MLTQVSQKSSGGLNWNKNPFSTRLFDAISILFPSGERFFIHVAQKVLETHDMDSSLSCDIQSFIKEENAHQRAHTLYNEKTALSFPKLTSCEQKLIADLDYFQQKMPLDAQICLVAAFEYMTAILSHLAIGNPQKPGSGWLSTENNAQTTLWRWHCGEEIAHWRLFMRVLENKKIKYSTRIFYFLMASAYLCLDISRHTALMSIHDFKKSHTRPLACLGGFIRFFAKSLPGILWALSRWSLYILPISRVQKLL
jgi:uncharacterized protein